MGNCTKVCYANEAIIQKEPTTIERKIDCVIETAIKSEEILLKENNHFKSKEGQEHM